MESTLPTTFFGWIWFLLQEYGSRFAEGTAASLGLSVLGTAAGCLIGLLVGVIQTIPSTPHSLAGRRGALWAIKALTNAYVGFFRGTPMMVQAVLMYYGFVQLTGQRISPLLAGLIVVSINTGAYMAETVRGGILSVDPGQTEGAKAIGMSHLRTMTKIVLPQAFRNIIPQIGNNLVGNIKDTSVLSVIAVNELFYMGRSASGTYFKYFEVFFIICIIYLVLNYLFTWLLKLLEKKIDGPSSYELASEFMDNSAA